MGIESRIVIKNHIDDWLPHCIYHSISEEIFLLALGLIEIKYYSELLKSQ